MEREILNMFARHLAHTRRPTAVAPGDQLNRWINCAHGSCKLDGLACRGFEVEAILVVGRFVADLPMPDSQRSRVSVSLPVGIPRIIAIRHPFGGFLRVGRAHAALNLHVLDRKSTRLNSSHGYISYAVFCLKKKKQSIDSLLHDYRGHHSYAARVD